MIDWVLAHQVELGTALVALHGAAIAIVNLTPTPRDDEVLARVYKVVEAVAGIFTARAKS